MAHPIRHQIIFLNVAILIHVLGIIAWSARETYREQIQQLETESRSTAATVVAYLERGLSIGALQTVIGEIPLPERSVITITDQHSVVLARSRHPEQYVGLRVEANALPPDQVPAYTVRVGVDGIERVFANTSYAPGPFLVSAGIPTDVAYSRVQPIVTRYIAISVGVALFTLILQFVLLRSYSSAFSRAIRFTKRVAAGDLSPPSAIPMPSREMEELQGAFIDMLGRLREAQNALGVQVAEERRMREELQSLQRHVIRRERLAAIGVLVSGVAHELNNPLQAIMGFADLLRMRTDLPPSVNADLALIQKESARANAIIRNLSRFTRQQTADPSVVRLRDVVASVVELRQRRLAEHDIELIVHESDTSVLAVFAELQQVLLNLMINAEQAVMDAPPPRRITATITQVDDRARLEVADTGPGVSPENEPKLFQPFFTTKPVGKGTGLGLSVSYGIIQSHGGSIGYQRGLDGGAMFFFELRALEASVPKR